MLSYQGIQASPNYEFVTCKIITFVNKKADGGNRAAKRAAEEGVDCAGHP
jgi:hypothetical protein